MIKQTASPGLSLLVRRAAAAAVAQAVAFAAEQVGALPVGWITGVTGRARYRWQVTVAAREPSPRNAQIGGAGTVGLWTKAGSVTVFDDFRSGRTPR